MRVVLSVFVAVLCSFEVFGQDVEDARNLPMYDSRYDYLDVDAILDSKRLVKNYVDCLINVKPCTPEGKALKRILPEALRTKCIRCTDKQKKTAVKVIKRLKYEYPEEWSKLSSRWDPTGDFTRFFEEFLAKDHRYNFVGTAGTTERTPASVPSSRPYPPQRSTPQVVIIPSSTPPSTETTPQIVDGTTPIKPIVLNRFGDDGELMIGGNGPAMTSRPMMTSPSSQRPVTMKPPSIRPMMAKPTEEMPTRIPLRPVNDMPPPYSTAITFIDQIGFKIIRTTELVTDILKNTVRAVVGG